LIIAAVADTHAALWHLFDDARLSASAGTFINEAASARHKIAISTISLGWGGLSDREERSAALEAVFTAAIVQVMRQVSRTEVPDMPDRVAAATAVYFDMPVISRDGRIRGARLKTDW
jgi:PIN domain nuclease of toxin-antitoxin system